MREEYEKQINKLRKNCTNNEHIMDSLKEILTLQEEEFYGRANKEKTASQST